VSLLSALLQSFSSLLMFYDVSSSGNKIRNALSACVGMPVCSDIEYLERLALYN